MKTKNPFIVVGYEGPSYFCDRARETRKIVGAIENGRNVTLIAPRRYGKTGLIHHVMGRLPSTCSCAYLDIFATQNLADFTRAFATAVLGAFDAPVEKTLATVARFFKSCRPTVTPQENGLPKFSFDLAEGQAAATLKEVFDYLHSRQKQVVIAIDEFQQILDYPEQGTEALLRAHVQSVPGVRFIFAGSRHHLMSQMFATAKHPFYQSTDVLSLDVIDPVVYASFASKHFAQGHFRFSQEIFNQLYARFQGITWYVQTVLNHVWEKGEGLTSTTMLDKEIDDLVLDRSLVFRDLFFSQSKAAQKLLKAIADEGEAQSVLSSAFIRRHELSATSTVRSAVKRLEMNDLVYRTERGYVVYDRLFMEWLKRL